MVRNFRRLSGLTLLALTISMSVSYEIDLKKYAATELKDSVACEYIDRFEMQNHDADTCTTKLNEGNCRVNYTLHEQDDALWQRGDRVRNIERMELVSGRCVTVKGLASRNEENVADQVIITMKDSASEHKDYFVYNIAKPGVNPKLVAPINQDFDIVGHSLNYSTAKFGRGIIIYPTVAGGYVYYFIDLLGLSPGARQKLPKGGCPSLVGKESVKPLFRNCLDSGFKFNNDDIFFTDIRYNYALWTSLILMLLFFAITIMAEPIEPLLSRYSSPGATNTSLHPWISVFKFGYECFSKKKRWTLIFISIAIYCCINSVVLMFFHPEDLHQAERLKFSGFNPIFQVAVPIVVSVIVSIIVGYGLGFFLVKIKDVHTEYVKNFLAANNQLAKDQLEDDYESKRASVNFPFYIICFLLYVILNVVSIWAQLNFHVDVKLNWLANVVICFVIEFVLDLVFMGIGISNEGARNVFKMRGFYYDYQLHKEFVALDEEE